MRQASILLVLLGTTAFGQARPPSAADWLAAHLAGAETFTGAKTFSVAILSGVASGSNAVALTTGQRIYGGNGYWYMDAVGGGRWITLVGLYIGGTISSGTSMDSSGDITAQGNLVAAGSLKAPVVHGAATALQAIEAGTASFAAAVGTVSFTTAFAAAPVCTCSAATVAVPCSVSIAPSTSGVTFAGTGTDAFYYICIGRK